MNRRDIIKLLAIAVILVMAVLLVNRIGDAHETKETEIVRDAVKNAALTCYAVEGLYPAELSYLRENYHLSYNEDRYIVYYEAFASNLMPYIKVVEKGAMDL